MESRISTKYVISKIYAGSMFMLNCYQVIKNKEIKSLKKSKSIYSKETDKFHINYNSYSPLIVNAQI